MVDDDGVPGEVEILRQHDAARVRSVDRRPGGGAEIGALMAAGGLAVGDRQPPEAAVRCAGNRSLKWPVPQTFGRQDRKRIGHRLGFLLDARELALRWIRHLWIHLESSRLESMPCDDERHCAVAAVVPLAVVP